VRVLGEGRPDAGSVTTAAALRRCTGLAGAVASGAAESSPTPRGEGLSIWARPKPSATLTSPVTTHTFHSP
jgi:hypothetical protein